MNNLNFIVFTVLLSVSLNVFSQSKEEEKETFSVSGSVDVYFTNNFENSQQGSVGVLYGGSGVANGFGLGMANTVFSYEKGKTGAVADLAFGPRANAANAYEGAINQLYVYYKPSESVTLTLGQFNTFFGYEVISPTVNFNYSVSYLFNAGPFSHTGLKVDYNASEDVSFMFAITNPHGIISGANPTNDYQFGFQTTYKDQYLNVVYGADGFGFKDVLYLDYTGVFDITNNFLLGINAAYSNSEEAKTGYQGAALYLQNRFSKKFSLGLRSEYFKTTSVLSDANVTAFTLSGNLTLTKNLKVIPEIRVDNSKDLIIPNFPTKETISGVTLAAVYSF